ncbi:MAG TPA: ComEA family DNA-binding protein [Anaerolineales bacterium]|nr:ComEA family DNA-binding protein [Anaerolineales bacterium]
MLAQARRFLFAVLLGATASGLLFLSVSKPRGKPIELLPPPTPSPLRIHVAGAVQRPGVYGLAPGSIVEDALRAAGGATSDADVDRINLAAPLTDGERISVPRSVTPAPDAPDDSDPGNGALDLNEATASDLEKLPGIGPGLAQAIIQYRTAHGPFRRVEDLLLVPGIGPSRLAQIRDLVRVD